MSQFRVNATLYTDLEVQCPNCKSVATHSLEAYNIFYLECETCSANLLMYRYLSSQFMVYAERIKFDGVKGLSTACAQNY